MKFNLANLITGSRLVFVPVMLALAWLGREQAFVICLTVSLVTDILDGKIARLLKQTSEFGTRLDSWADFSTYTTLPLCAYWMRPDLVANEWVACVIVVASFVVPIAIGFAKFRQLTSYHTKMATVAAYCIGASTIVMFAHGPTWPFRLATAVLVLAELEEIAITFTLPKAHSNVASFRHARALRGQMEG